MPFSQVFNKNFFLILFLIALAELLSYFGFLWPAVNTAVFFIIGAAVLVLSLKDLKFGLLALLAELFIGSKGYLFFFEAGGLTISIRIALWLIIMSVWLANVITRREWQDFIKLPYAKYFYALFAFVGLGLVVGYFNGNELSNIFFDANNWFYLTLIFPLAQSFRQGRPHPNPLLGKERENSWQLLLKVFAAAMIWLAAETMGLLFFFAHYGDWEGLGIYRWLRVSGVGEVTNMSSGFVRVFFQSHIYLLFAVCLLLPVIIGLVRRKPHPDPLLRKERGGLWLSWGLMTVALTVVIITQSRSFLVGLFVAGSVLIIYLLKNKLARSTWLKFAGLMMMSVVVSLLIMTALVKLPGLGAWNALSQRSNLNEAAVSSRWALLPKLWQKIGESPIIGKGFGTTIIYKSSDPRVLETHPDGLYETYAFEWGWLDLWLKLSIAGALFYLWFLFILARDAWRLKSALGTGLVLIITTLAVVNIFSPYLNHPLGLGAIMLIALAIKNYELRIKHFQKLSLIHNS